MSNPETQLISQSLAGKSEAFAKLYEMYIKPIYRYHYYRTFHKETAEDLTSQTFIRALERLATYDAKKGTFSAWLYRIGRNLLIDHVRTTHPTSDIEASWDSLRDQKDVVRTLETAEALKKASAYLKNLSTEQQEIILLRLWDECSYKEIAEITQKSEAACKMAVSRTLQVLRQNVPLALLLSLIHTTLLSTYASHT